MSFLSKIPLTARNLVLILCALFILTLLLMIYFIHMPLSAIDAIQNLRLEIIKSLLSIIIVTIIGTTVTFLFKVYEKNQEQLKVQTQVKLDFIKRVGQLYRTIKKIRRKLRSEGIKMSEWETELKLTERQIVFYSKQMEELNDVQLEIEGFKTAAESSFLFENSELIRDHLRHMEHYLNKIVGEFENANHTMHKEGKVDLKELKYLREFTSSAKNRQLENEVVKESKDEPDENLPYGFKREFSLSYGKLLRSLKV